MTIGSLVNLDALCHTRMIVPNEVVPQVIGKGNPKSEILRSLSHSAGLILLLIWNEILDY